jgi:hypothetical protein
MIPNEKIPKKSPKYSCSKCNYNTCSKKDFSKHLLTKKHLMVTNPNNPNEKIPKNPHTINHVCECGKIYSHQSSLCAHKKKCIIISNKENKETTLDLENKETILKEDTQISLGKNELINYLMKENSEFKEMLLEQNKLMMKVCEKNSVINNINSNNKTFNLNVFLNEQCKDAMNIMDFVDSLKIQLSDLENVGKLGFVEGITNIIIKNLKALDIHKRPVHCSDTKREVMYVKDSNRWEKENEEKNKLRKAIKHIAHKNSKMLPEFKAKYPDCIYSDSKKSDQYNKIIIEAMGGNGDHDDLKENKIIKNIAKEVIINKIIE